MKFNGKEVYASVGTAEDGNPYLYFQYVDEATAADPDTSMELGEFLTEREVEELAEELNGNALKLAAFNMDSRLAVGAE